MPKDTLFGPHDVDYAVSWDWHRFYSARAAVDDPGPPYPPKPEKPILPERTCSTCKWGPGNAALCDRQEVNCLSWLPPERDGERSLPLEPAVVAKEVTRTRKSWERRDCR
jgi:hypothetical protein